MNENSVVLSNQDETGGTSAAHELQLISFRLGEEAFGVEIDHVKEILKLTDITPIPKAPPYLLGMMNLRGTIIPILDPKKRLDLPPGPGHTEKSRILVLLVSGQFSGVIVDEVSEVRRIGADAVEPPPPAAHGIDKFYLQGVVKFKDKNRLLLMLNLGEVLNIDISKEIKAVSDTLERGDIFDTREKVKEDVQEEQFVTFHLGEEEFGLDIAAVKEILRLDEITAVPNVPPYVKGIQNVRDQVLPIIEMRKVVDMDTLEHFHTTLVERLRNSHTEWVEHLKAALHGETVFAKATDPTKCELGRLLEFWRTRGIEFADMYKKFKPPHDGLHMAAVDILKLAKTDIDAADRLFRQKIAPYLETLMALFIELEDVLKKHDARDQRILIVNIENTTVGLLVDRVTEVSRLPKRIIDTTPAVISSYGKEIKGIAKLDNGKRLILLVDEKLLIPMEDVETISKIGEEGKETQKEEEIKERQYVIFSIQGEEFGITIDNVREIFRFGEITTVPKAPSFIKGVTNLRGNIIPIVDTRERFGVTADTFEIDGFTGFDTEKEQKILVTVIKDTIVGLLVDSVHEVLRVSENLIEDAPSLVLSNVDTAYLEGIAKLNGGQRIILLLNVNEIMTKKDFAKLKKIKEQAEVKVEEKPKEKEEVEVKKKPSKKRKTKEKK